jgi:two-component system LytT family response regulator
VSNLRALIVDDEPPARRELRRLLLPHPDVEVVGDAASVAEARDMVAAFAPDILFLDLRLDRDIGFEVLPTVPSSTAVIIVTAYDRYAVKAFETNALDYLLKPVAPARLGLALARVRTAKLQVRLPEEAVVRLPDQVAANDWLLLRDGGAESFVRAASIACIVAEGDYTRVCTIDGRSRLVHRTLRDWESRLSPDLFARVHRSALANLQHVIKIERGPGSAGLLILRGHEPLEVSRREAARLRKRHA